MGDSRGDYYKGVLVRRMLGTPYRLFLLGVGGSTPGIPIMAQLGGGGGV